MVNKKRVVITGVGILSSIGIGKSQYWQALAEGRSGTKPITLFDTTRFKVNVGGEITDFNAKEILGKLGLVDLDRATTLLSAAMKFALEDAGFSVTGENTRRTGISVGTTFGSLHSLTEFDKDCLTGGPRFVNPSRFPNTVINSPASRAAIRFGVKGFNATVSTGFCAGLDAVDYAVHALMLDRADRVLVGAVEEMCQETFLGFHQLGYLSGLKDGSSPVSRPFDRNRDGIVFAEGAGMVLLESWEAAAARRARVYAEVVSTASNFDPKGFFRFNKKGTGMMEVMRSALKQSGCQREDIDGIFASANSTTDGDAVEAMAIQKVFGTHARRVPVTAVKSMTGETFSASGGINLAAALGSLEEQFIPPTINGTDKDRNCDLNCPSQTIRNKKIRHVMVNGFDPGGAGTVLVLRKGKR